MRIERNAIAGTLESSDAQVRIEPAAENKGIYIEIKSVVMKQFGNAIEASAREVLAEEGVDSASLFIEDRGAIDCVLRARIKTAITRAGGVDQ